MHGTTTATRQPVLVIVQRVGQPLGQLQVGRVLVQVVVQVRVDVVLVVLQRHSCARPALLAGLPVGQPDPVGRLQAQPDHVAAMRGRHESALFVRVVDRTHYPADYVVRAHLPEVVPGDLEHPEVHGRRWTERATGHQDHVGHCHLAGRVVLRNLER